MCVRRATCTAYLSATVLGAATYIARSVSIKSCSSIRDIRVDVGARFGGFLGFGGSSLRFLAPRRNFNRLRHRHISSILRSTDESGGSGASAGVIPVSSFPASLCLLRSLVTLAAAPVLPNFPTFRDFDTRICSKGQLIVDFKLGILR